VSNVLQVVSTFSPIIASAAAVYVAWTIGRGQLAIGRRQADIADQQAKLADVRLRHDLYDRRFAVYNAARMFLLREILPTNQVTNDALYALVRGTADAVFLLDGDVTAYLEELRKNAVRFQLLTTAIDTMQREEERKRVSDQKLTLREWFEKQPDVLVEKFKPFITLDASSQPREQHRQKSWS
jgi:hypothetical protein